MERSQQIAKQHVEARDRFIGAPEKWYWDFKKGSSIHYSYSEWVEKKLLETLNILDKLKANGCITGYQIEGIK